MWKNGQAGWRRDRLDSSVKSESDELQRMLLVHNLLELALKRFLGDQST